MIDWEKVIKGLECCMAEKICTSKCPYKGQCDDGGYYYSKAIEDAISLLKAQEPRVMTLEEVKQAKGRDVWLELSGIFAETALTAATIEGCGTKGICTRYESLKYTQYCVRPCGWRCWSARPTDEQRETTPWN